MTAPSPSEHPRAGTGREVAGVAVPFHDDAEPLRYALAVEHIRPGVHLVVTIFDGTVAGQLERTVPDCRSPHLPTSPLPCGWTRTGRRAR
ncbi:hypothetical protein [Streptomyces sp. 891-h]|uniref:hypothetical protein n=1 Tax=Streptomyces sp. 891-h TaxID=2720714 RepID=UPI001FAAB3CE|nr:hypothetical protein [Streptomyces sp. 891-h]